MRCGVIDRFNRRYNYPYVFLNDLPFSAEFMLHTTAMASGPTTYGIIPSNEWADIPPWIDQTKMQEGVDEMAKLPIPYGDSVTYRKMCRYQSGWFWRHPLLDTYKFYWRIE
jgi:alpha 1,2-mannosyltransferase